MLALHCNETWDLVPLPLNMKTVSCHWVDTIKYQPEGTIDHLKACHIVEGYTQTYGLDYAKTYSPVLKLLQYGYSFL
jgi:hypothetical protein